MSLLRDLELSDLFPRPGYGSKTLLVLGAGASAPSAPIADDLKRGILDGCSQFVGGEPVSCPDDDRLTLEVLCSLLRFRLGDRLNLTELLRHLLQTNVVPSSAFVQAELIKQGLVTYVFTANFDDLLYRACRSESVLFRLITRNQLEDQTITAEVGSRGTAALRPEPGDIFAFHGTLYKPADSPGLPIYSPPTSADARGLATPFSARVEEYIEAVISSVDTIVFWGYSGRDHYDLTPVLGKILTERSSTVRNLYWFSFRGIIEKDFSPEVVALSRKFAEAISSRTVTFVHCQEDVAGPVASYLYGSTSRRALGIRTAKRPEARKLDDLTATFLDTVAPLDSTRSAVREFLIDVGEAKIWIVWLIIEHFHLDSLGLAPDALRSFGAYSRSGRFFTLDVEGLSKAIESYWQLNNGGANKRRDIIEQTFPAGQIPSDEPFYDLTPFGEASEGFQATIRGAGSLESWEGRCELPRGVRDVDAALLTMCSAIAENYCGLIMLREFEDGYDWTRELSSRLRRARRAAGKHFDRAVKLSCLAKSHLSGYQASGLPELLDLVAPNVWYDIAAFNKARVLSGRRGIREMIAVVERQDQLIKDLAGYLQAANLLQICQRASVLVKRIYEVKGSADSPLPNKLRPRSRRAEWALEIAQVRRQEYEAATGRFDGRLFAVCDAMVVDALARGEIARAQNILSEFQKKKSHRPGDLGKVEGWITNIKQRIAEATELLAR